ncbi:hypothetical protein ACLK1S_03170 [Escherichia coli]
MANGLQKKKNQYSITELPDSWVVEGAKLPYEVAVVIYYRN